VSEIKDEEGREMNERVTGNCRAWLRRAHLEKPECWSSLATKL